MSSGGNKRDKEKWNRWDLQGRGKLRKGEVQTPERKTEQQKVVWSPRQAARLERKWNGDDERM